MRLTLNVLIEALEAIRDDIGGDIPVMGVYQPNYPLQAGVVDVGRTEDTVFLQLAGTDDYAEAGIKWESER
jgi:hypothetical protein